MWKKHQRTSNNKIPEVKSKKEQLQDIYGKLASISGCLLVMRYEVADNFKDFKRQNLRYLYSLQNKAEMYFYTIMVLFFISFCQQQLREVPLFISLLSDQSILKFFKLLFRG